MDGAAAAVQAPPTSQPPPYRRSRPPPPGSSVLHCPSRRLVSQYGGLRRESEPATAFAPRHPPLRHPLYRPWLARLHDEWSVLRHAPPRHLARVRSGCSSHDNSAPPAAAASFRPLPATSGIPQQWPSWRGSRQRRAAGGEWRWGVASVRERAFIPRCPRRPAPDSLGHRGGQRGGRRRGLCERGL